MAPTIKTEASIKKTERKRVASGPQGHSTEYKRDKLIDKVRNTRPMRDGAPYDPEALVAEYERAMDVKIINKDTDASLYSVGKVIDDVWHLHLEDMSDYRVFCNGVAVAHKFAGAADTPAENVERLGRITRFGKVYTKMYGHPPSDYYYSAGGARGAGGAGGLPPAIKGDKFTIFFKTLSSTTHTIEIKKDATMSRLFSDISWKGGYPIDQIRLIYKNRQLIREGGVKVRDVLEDNCTVCIVLSMRGC